MAEQVRMGNPFDRLTSRVTGVAGKPGAPSAFQQILGAIMQATGGLGMRMPGAQPATPPAIQMPQGGNFGVGPHRMNRLQQQVQAPANTNVPGAAAPEAGQVLQMRGGDPMRSQVGQLNRLNDVQFQRYMDARSQGKSPEEAMTLAMGD